MATVALPAIAQDSKVPLDYAMTPEDNLAQALNNPLANLITVPIQTNFDYGGGRNDDGFRYSLVAQPVIPFELGKDWNLIARTVIPYANVSNVFPRDAMEKIIPLGRGGTPDEAAGAVHLFCIPESDCVSRQTLMCSGDLGGF